MQGQNFPLSDLGIIINMILCQLTSGTVKFPVLHRNRPTLRVATRGHTSYTLNQLFTSHPTINLQLNYTHDCAAG